MTQESYKVHAGGIRKTQLLFVGLYQSSLQRMGRRFVEKSPRVEIMGGKKMFLIFCLLAFMLSAEVFAYL